MNDMLMLLIILLLLLILISSLGGSITVGPTRSSSQSWNTEMYKAHPGSQRRAKRIGRMEGFSSAPTAARAPGTSMNHTRSPATNISHANTMAPVSNMSAPVANRSAPVSNMRAPVANRSAPVSNMRAPATSMNHTNTRAPVTNMRAPATSTYPPHPPSSVVYPEEEQSEEHFSSQISGVSADDNGYSFASVPPSQL